MGGHISFFEEEVPSTFPHVVGSMLQTDRVSYALAWHMMFECTWRNFENRFGSILADLKRHSDLLDREAASIHFAEAKEAALASQAQIEDLEVQKRRVEWREVHQWLAVDDVQDTRLERLMERCQAGSCEWVFRNESIASWLHENRNKPIVWIKGNPGSGKCLWLLVTIGLLSVFAKGKAWHARN